MCEGQEVREITAEEIINSEFNLPEVARRTAAHAARVARAKDILGSDVNTIHRVPAGDGETTVRVTRLTIVPRGEPIYDERAITVEIVDEAAGEFVKVYGQTSDDVPEFDPKDWPVVRSVIDYMVDHCRSNQEMDAERKPGEDDE